MWLIMLATGCYSNILHGEEGQLVLKVEEVTAGPNQGLDEEVPLLEGTQVCVTACRWGTGGMFQDPCADEEAIHACYAQSIEGDASLDGACLDLGSAGDVRWSFDRIECSAQLEEPLEDDRVELRVVGADEVVARPVRSVDELALWFHDATETDEEFDYWLVGADLPRDVTTMPGQELRIIRGGSAAVEITLQTTDGERVARQASQTVVVQGEATWNEETIELTPTPGSSGQLSLAVGGHEFPAGTWTSVGEEEVASIALSVLGYVNEEGASEVYGARVTARDAQGELLDGVPVVWSQSGDPIAPTLLGGDIYTLNDACVDPADQVPGRSTTLVVSLGELQDEVSFSWDEASNGDQEQSGRLPADYCPSTGPEDTGEGEAPGGCGCSSPGAGWVVAWAPLLVGLVRRRRHG